MSACCGLINKMGGKILGVTILIELSFLNGRQRLKPYDDVHSVLKY